MPPGRTTLLELDTWVQMKLMGRPVVNGIVTVGDVLLPELEFDEYSEEAYRYGAAPIAEDFGALSAYVESLGGTFCYVGFPEQRVYFEDCIDGNKIDGPSQQSLREAEWSHGDIPKYVYCNHKYHELQKQMPCRPITWSKQEIGKTVIDHFPPPFNSS